ncbi:MAG: NAD(P)H-dependent oxidoreductase subunit E [Chloroflexi bacterium]|nr:NAD(P)H-dependent oxidoreductase subunit E [Chloroflexota bacterium]
MDIKVKETKGQIAAILESYHHDKKWLISILQDIQGQHHYLPREALVEVSEGLKIPLSQVYSVATFFKAFSLKPRGEHTVTCCMGTACHVRGAVKVLEKLERDLGVNRGDTTANGKYTLETVNCVGACALGPIVIVDGEHSGQMTTDKVKPLLEKYS